MCRKLSLCLCSAATCLALAALSGILTAPNDALAAKGGKPGGGKPGGGGSGPNCVLFDDLPGDSVQSDDCPDGQSDCSAYCSNKDAKIDVNFSSFGDLALNTNSRDKAGQGRGIFVDFGTDVTLAPGTDNEVTISATDELPEDILVRATITVGMWQDSVDFFAMGEGESNTLVNLTLRVRFYFPDGERGSLLIRLSPDPLDNGRECPGSSPVRVTRIDAGSWYVTTDLDGVGGTDPGAATPEGWGCISRGGAGESGAARLCDNEPDEPCDVNLQIGFTVTAAQ